MNLPTLVTAVHKFCAPNETNGIDQLNLPMHLGKFSRTAQSVSQVVPIQYLLEQLHVSYKEKFSVCRKSTEFSLNLN